MGKSVFVHNWENDVHSDTERQIQASIHTHIHRAASAFGKEERLGDPEAEGGGQCPLACVDEQLPTASEYSNLTAKYYLYPDSMFLIN